jgi:hypothetical protein
MKFIFKNFLKNNNQHIILKKKWKYVNINYLFKKQNLKIRNIITHNVRYNLIDLNYCENKRFKTCVKLNCYNQKKSLFRKKENLYYSINTYIFRIHPLNKILSSFSTKLCVFAFSFIYNKNSILKLKEKLLPVRHFRNFFFNFRTKFLLFCLKIF